MLLRTRITGIAAAGLLLSALCLLGGSLLHEQLLRQRLAASAQSAQAALWAEALAAALWAALRPGARLEAQRRAVLARLQQGRSDGLPPPEGRGQADGLQRVLDTLAQGDDEQRAAHAALQAYAHELLSVDFDGHMRAGIERIVRQCAQDELK